MRYQTLVRPPQFTCRVPLVSAAIRSNGAYLSRIPHFRTWPKAQHAAFAVRIMAVARTREAVYQYLVDDALRQYGDHGSLISGVIRDHFPIDVKTRLRRLARRYSHASEVSRAHWRAAGRRLDTWRRLAA